VKSKQPATDMANNMKQNVVKRYGPLEFSKLDTEVISTVLEGRGIHHQCTLLFVKV
jgi:hypothetical protein